MCSRSGAILSISGAMLFVCFVVTAKAHEGTAAKPVLTSVV